MEVEDEVEASGEAVAGVEVSTEEDGVEEVEASVEVEVEDLEAGEVGEVVRTEHRTPPRTVFLNIFFIFSRTKKLY